jgi:phosphoglycolate phosphatase
LAKSSAVFFDLDGTLVDTAPDMVATLQAFQRDHGVREIEYGLGRAHVSNGAAGLLRAGFPELDDAQRERLVAPYVERYKHRIAEDSSVFDGLSGLLESLDDLKCRWGVVTNKPTHLTEPLMQALGLLHRSAATVCGDTLPQRKPDPAPLLHACKLADVSPQQAIYVGDAARDIEGGNAAGMTTVAATYGYIVAEDDPLSWGADLIVADSEDLAQIILKAVTL